MNVNLNSVAFDLVFLFYLHYELLINVEEKLKEKEKI